MAGGGKGGSSTTSVEIPEYLEEPIKRNIAKAEEIARIGYTPYFGPDVAAMTPMQQAAGQNIMGAAQAFGLAQPTSAMAGMPQATDYGGLGAYSSAPLYQQSLGRLEQEMPGQFAALQAPFINPVTGAQPLAPFYVSPEEQAVADAARSAVSEVGFGGRGNGGDDNRFERAPDPYAGMSEYDRAAAQQRDFLEGSRGGVQVSGRDSAGGLGGGK